MKHNGFKLTEKQLGKILRESINKLFDKENAEDEAEFLSKYLDLSKFDFEILKHDYKDFRLIPKSVAYTDNKLFSISPIREAIMTDMEPDNIVKSITQKYNLSPGMVVKREYYHNIYIYLAVARLGINDKLIEEDMKKLGYFMSSCAQEQVVNGLTYHVLKFEPTSQIQIDETDNIKKSVKILMHWTPIYNLKGIVNNGLTPRCDNSILKYPPRIYLIDGNSSEDKIYSLGAMICVANKNIKNDGRYALIGFPTNILDDSIRLYYDPNSEIGIYTEQPIPPNIMSVLAINDFSQHMLKINEQPNQ